jgi:hypothetical protein
MGDLAFCHLPRLVVTKLNYAYWKINELSFMKMNTLLGIEKNREGKKYLDK